MYIKKYEILVELYSEQLMLFWLFSVILMLNVSENALQR